MTWVRDCYYAVIVLALTWPGLSATQPEIPLGRTIDGQSVTSSTLLGVSQKDYTNALAPLFSWNDTNRLTFEAGACLSLPPTNVSVASVQKALNLSYDKAVQWRWSTLLLNRALEDATLANTKPQLAELDQLASLVANKEAARRTLIYELSPSLTDEAYAEAWRKFYARHRPKYPKDNVERGLSAQVSGRTRWQNSNFLAIDKTMRVLLEPSYLAISNQVWQEARAALVSQTMRALAKAPPPDLVLNFVALHARRFPCQGLITTNDQRAADWLLAARQTIVTNSGTASLFEMLDLKESTLLPTGRHATSLAKLQEAFGSAFETMRLPRAYSLMLPHHSALANETYECAYDATVSGKANMIRSLSTRSLPSAKRTGILVLIVGPPEAVKPEEVAKQQGSELREFAEQETTRRIIEQVRSKFEWLNPDYFPSAKEMRELLFGRELVWALRGFEH